MSCLSWTPSSFGQRSILFSFCFTWYWVIWSSKISTCTTKKIFLWCWEMQFTIWLSIWTSYRRISFSMRMRSIWQVVNWVNFSRTRFMSFTTRCCRISTVLQILKGRRWKIAKNIMSIRRMPAYFMPSNDKSWVYIMINQ